MRVTLDWDESDVKNEHWEQFKRAADGRPWELRQSSSGDGYHAVGYEFFNETRSAVDRMFNLRETLGDDEKRIDLDEQRWDLGSPFIQVLYSRKYMDRWERPDPSSGYSSGNTVQVLEQSDVKIAAESRRIKDEDTGRLDYNRITQILVSDTFDTLAEAAESLEVSGRTVRRWRDREAEPNSSNRERLKRRARYYGIGHYVADEEGNGHAAEDVKYVDDDQTRRTIVEYLDVPWGSDPSDVGDPDREYALCQVETGTFNFSHTEGQHRQAHENAVEVVQDRLSPESPINGVQLDLDRDLGRSKGWRSEGGTPAIRNPDSVHYESEILDDGEGELYAANLPKQGRISGQPTSHIITEVLLWDEAMNNVLWHVLLVDDGSDWTDHTVLRDSRGWW